MSTSTTARLSASQQHGLGAGFALLLLGAGTLQCAGMSGDAAAQVVSLVCTNLAMLVAAVLVEDHIGMRLRRIVGRAFGPTCQRG